MFFLFFFFSSRRRHTRLQGDWSSDVCSSDLPASETSGDDEPLYLLRSFIELRDLCVAHHPLDRELIDIAVPTQDLDGVGRHPHGVVTGDEFTHRRPAGRVARSRLDLRAGLVQ